MRSYNFLDEILKYKYLWAYETFLEYKNKKIFFMRSYDFLKYKKIKNKSLWDHMTF